MGGTLDNGIYLPDQGERNCYNGLKNNWDTLDNLIETVQALSSAGLTREIVNSLPTDNIKTNVIYMLRNSQQSGDLYDEYMYINNAWEPIGTSATEMDNYYTKSETNALPAVASGITASKVTGYDSHVANTEVHITAAERSTWNGKQNALDTDQTAAVNSGVNATKVTGYDTHVADTVVHVTSSDKTAWSAKQDGLSQTQLNAVNSGVTDTKVTGYDAHVADSSAHVSSSDRTAWNGKQDALSQTQLNNIAAVPDKANSADLATVATTGDYGDLLNAPTIPTVNNATLTIQKNGTDVATFTANASSNVTANLAIPTKTSELDNDAGFLTQHNPIDNELSATSENALQNKVVKSELDGKAPLVHTHAASDVTSGTFNIARIPNLDASKITSGTIDIARLPKGSLERLVKVADQAARFALTTDDVQLGDTVQQLDTGVMYVVTDETKLDSADGYTEFTAGSATSVPWSGVTGKPSSFTPSSHTHGNVSNDGKLPTASRALISDSSKKITVSSVTDTELGYLSGVTSAIQTQLNAKADDSGVVHKTGNETISGTKTFSNSTNVDLSIQKGTSSGSCNIRFNDNTGLSRTVIRSYNDKLEIGHLRNANWYDGAEFVLKDDGSSKIKSNDGTTSVEVSFNPDSVKPTNSVIDLGTSSNKWKSVYADSYYLGTTAFGDIATHNASEFSASNHVHGSITNDGKLGTTANLPLITGTGGVVQAGSFGNAANTFCEGNDSRLSNARTPVAHTHSKADITDLFNSANVWTGDNTYTKYQNIVIDGTEIGVAPNAQNRNGLLFKDKNGVNIGWLRHQYDTSGDISIEMLVSNKYKNGALDPTGTQAYQGVKQTITSNGTSYFNWSGYVNNSLYPYTTETFNIGDSTHQWNNLYAKNYYYNGTAWGLDKVNAWSENNRFNKNAPLSSISSLNDPTLGFSANSNTIFFNTRGSSNYSSYGTFLFAGYSTGASPDRNAQFKLVRSTDKKGDTNDGYTPDSSFNLWRVAPHYLIMDMMEAVRVTNDGNENSLKPITNNVTDLGTSTNKWKTLNGVNPGALSLPDAASFADISGNITNLDGTDNFYTPAVNGWISVCVGNNSPSLSMYCDRNNGWGASFAPANINTIFGMLPLVAGNRVRIRTVCGTLFYARFYPCLGNV